MKTIFFDIDNTLINHDIAEEKAANAFFDSQEILNNFYEKDDFISVWKSIARKYLIKYFNNEISFQQQKRLRIQEIYKNKLKEYEVDSLFDQFVKFYVRNLKLYEDVIPCLKQVKKYYKLGIISNGNSEQQKKKLIQMNLASFFKVIIISEDLKVSKPNVEIFQYASNKINEPISNCIYIGDNLQTDAIAANNAGMIGIWINRLNEPVQYENTISSLSDLNNILGMINGNYK